MVKPRTAPNLISYRESISLYLLHNVLYIKLLLVCRSIIPPPRDILKARQLLILVLIARNKKKVFNDQNDAKAWVSG